MSSLIWVCTVCPGLSVRKLRIIAIVWATLFIFGIQILQLMYTNTEGMLMTLPFGFDFCPGRHHIILRRAFFFYLFPFQGYMWYSGIIWAVTRQNQQNNLCAQRRLSASPSTQSWSESSLCAQLVAKDPRFLHADIQVSDLSDGCTGYFVLVSDCRFGVSPVNYPDPVGFVMWRLIW